MLKHYINAKNGYFMFLLFCRCLTTSVSKSSEGTDESGIETDISNDTTLFQLLSNSQPVLQNKNENTPKSFENILQHLNQKEEVSSN